MELDVASEVAHKKFAEVKSASVTLRATVGEVARVELYHMYTCRWKNFLGALKINQKEIIMKMKVGEGPF